MGFPDRFPIADLKVILSDVPKRPEVVNVRKGWPGRYVPYIYIYWTTLQ
jgi:hypothetical protein